MSKDELEREVLELRVQLAAYQDYYGALPEEEDARILDEDWDEPEDHDTVFGGLNLPEHDGARYTKVPG